MTTSKEPTEPSRGEARRQELLDKYQEGDISEAELEEFLALLRSDIEYAEWERKNADALKRLAGGVRAKLILQRWSS